MIEFLHPIVTVVTLAVSALSIIGTLLLTRSRR